MRGPTRLASPQEDDHPANRDPRRKLLAPAALILAALAAACTSAKSVPLGLTLSQAPPGVTFSSTPPGAAVWVNGVDTGFLTPCHIDLDDGDWHQVDIVRPGYRTATRVLSPDWRLFTVYWSDMDHGPRTWRFPLWLGAGDLIPPVRYVGNLSPTRIHVRLVLAPEPEDELEPPGDAGEGADAEGAAAEPGAEPDEDSGGR